MASVLEFLSNPWYVLVLAAMILRLTSPVWRLWLHRRNRRWLRKNGRPAPAKILNFRETGLSIGARESTGVVGGKMRWASVELEVFPLNGDSSCRVKTFEQLHPNDMVGIVPGMEVGVLVHPKKRHTAVVSDWGEGRPLLRVRR